MFSVFGHYWVVYIAICTAVDIFIKKENIENRLLYLVHATDKCYIYEEDKKLYQEDKCV